MMKLIKGLKIAAMVPLGFTILVLLAFAVGESIGGDWSGLMHLVPIIFIGFAIWLCWRSPHWGGMLLLAWALFEMITFGRVLVQPNLDAVVAPLVILILPLVVSGGLLLWAGRLEKRRVVR